MRFGPLILCLCPLLCAQDSQTPPQGLIRGKVVNSATGEPVRKAKVELLSMGAPRPAKEEAGAGTAVTDAAGRFEFTALAPGGYALSATHDGYDSANAHGGVKLQRVTLGAGQEKDDVVIRLTPFGVVTGRILDEDGDPLRGIQVQAMIYKYSASGRHLEGRGDAATNDLGQYRIYDLPAGRYYLEAGSAESMGGRENNEAYGVSYYPGTAEAASASAVEVSPGETLDGMDLTLRPTRTATISGRIVGPASGLTIGLLKSAEDGSTWNTNMDTGDTGGKFKLQGVSPGSYFLTAGGTVGGQHLSASMPIQVGTADLEGIELHLQLPIDIAGQIRVEGKTGLKLSGRNVVLDNHGMRSMSKVNEDGSFTLQGLQPAVYAASVEGPDDLYLKAVRLAEKDVTQSGVDLTQGAGESRLTVVMSADGGEIDGVVSDDQSRPVAMAIVTLIPLAAQPVKSLYKWTQTSPAGHFHMRGIAPGSYKLFAWEDADPNQVLYDPDFLTPYDSLAKSIEIAEGGKESVQLAVIAEK